MLEISRELGAGSDLCHSIEKHGRSQWLPGAGQDDGNMQKSPLMGSLRDKKGSILFLKFITLI